MKPLIIILIAFASCSKPKDYSYLNTDRRTIKNWDLILKEDWYIENETYEFDTTTYFKYSTNSDTSFASKPQDTVYYQTGECLLNPLHRMEIRKWIVRYY